MAVVIAVAFFKMFLCCLCINRLSSRRANSDPEYTRENIRRYACGRRLTSTRELQDTASEQHSSQTQAGQPLLQNNPTEEEDNLSEKGDNLLTSNYNPTVDEYDPPKGEYNPSQEEFCPSQGGYKLAQKSYNPTDRQQGYYPDHQGSGYVDPKNANTNNVTLIDLESNPSLPYTDNFQVC